MEGKEEPGSAPEPGMMPEAKELPGSREEPAPPPPRPQKAGALAILALVLSVVGLLVPLSGVAGVVAGFVELNRIKSGRSSAKGYSFARAAIIVGIIAVVLNIILTIYMLETGGITINTATT